jgi:colanic acid/amylovoran biosynthesis protein
VTNILLIHIHSSRNAGDAALTLATIQQLRQNFPSCHITLAMDDPDQPDPNVTVVSSLFAWVKPTGNNGSSSWRIFSLLWLPFAIFTPLFSRLIFHRVFFGLTPAVMRPLLRAYLDADLVVSKPGGFLYSSGLGLTLIISVVILVMAWIAGKPFYIFPQSIGPLRRTWEYQLLRWILGKARIVMVREKVSLDLLNSCRFTHPRLYMLPDTAFAFQGALIAEADAWLHSQALDLTKDRPLLGLTAIDWGAQNPAFTLQSEYEAACAWAIRFFVKEHGGRVILFPQVSGPTAAQDDHVPARRIAAQLEGLGITATMVEQTLPPALLKSVYGQMDLFIGTRMHSNIFALSMGVPCLAIGYMHKTRGIAEMAGMGEWVLNIGDVTSSALAEKLEGLWQARQAIRQTLHQVLPSLTEQANRAGKLVASDFQGLIS